MLQNIHRRPPTNAPRSKLNLEDYQKIKLPRCSSLYSQFHYKIGNQELEKMVFGKHKLVISNLEALRTKDTLYIKQLKATVSKLEKGLAESSQKLSSYEQKMKDFFFKKLEKMGEHLASIAMEAGTQYIEHKEQISSFVKKHIEKISGLMKNFGIWEIDEILNFMVSEELKKSVFADNISQNKLLMLSAENSSQKQRICELEEMTVELTTKNKIYSQKIRQHEQNQKDISRYKSVCEEQRVQLEKMTQKHQEIMLKSENLEAQLFEKLQKQTIEPQIEEKYMNQLDYATKQFRLEMNHSKIEQFTRQELITNQQYTQMDKKNLTILYKEKLSFVLHLFRKFEFQSLQRFNKLTEKINGLEQQVKTQDYFISKQTRIIRQLQKHRSASMKKSDAVKENEELDKQCKKRSGKSIGWINNARSNKKINIFETNSKSKHKIRL